MPLFQKLPKQKTVYNGRCVVLREIETQKGNTVKAHMPTSETSMMTQKPTQKGGSVTAKDPELDKKALKQKLMQEIYKRL